MIEMSLELKKRVITAGVGAAILLSLLILGGWVGAFCFVTVISLGMIFEYTEITYSMGDRVEKRYFLLSLSWLVTLLNWLMPFHEFPFFMFFFMMLFGYFLWTAKRHMGNTLNTHFKELVYSIFGGAYLVFMPVYFLRIYEAPSGVAWTILFLLVNWAGDSAAYFVGKRYGKEKLYPEISPKKTREGALGGLAAGVLVACIYKFLFLRNLSLPGAVIMACLVGAIAQIGDLCESFFKRAFEMKDSGSILPGHGGFLDRFDGVIFSLPVMYACVRLFG